MEITFPPDLERFIEYMVRKGEYASPEDVVKAGIARMRGSDEDLDAERKRVMAMIQVGLDDLDAGRSRDGEEVMRELRERYASLAEREMREVA